MSEPLFLIPALVVGAVLASWLADRLRIPSILTLLTVGVLVGPILGVFDPSAVFGDLLIPMVSVAVAVILFEGGLSLRLSEIEGSQRIIWSLVSVGAIVTWAVAAAAAWWFTDLGSASSVLLGSILVVSGPTVIGPILQSVRPTRRVASILKWESIFVDPIGAMLAVITFNVITSDQGRSGRGVILEAVEFVGVGVAVGAIAALAAVFVLRRHWVPEHLVSIFGLATALAAYMGAEVVFHESGLLATTVVGLVLSNHPRVSTESIVTFSEVIRVLLIGILFIVLSARLTREQLSSIGLGTVGIVIALVFVARPLAVWLSTLRSDLSFRRRVFLAGVAPRGIVAASVASVLGLDLESAGVAGADRITPVAFAVIVATVLLYGLGAGPLARRLGVASENQEGVLVLGAGSVERAIATTLHEAGLDVVVATVNRRDESRARMAGLRTFYGDVLHEDVDLRLELSGIGRFFAVTPNDDVNTLAARRFKPLFGRGETFQLPPSEAGEGLVQGETRDLGGRVMFREDATYERLRRLLEGHSVEMTPLTEEFDLDDFHQEHGEAMLLFALRDRRLLVAATDTPNPFESRLQAGDQLFWLAENSVRR